MGAQTTANADLFAIIKALHGGKAATQYVYASPRFSRISASAADRVSLDAMALTPSCLRTLTGARQFCAIRSYLSTAAKHGIGFFDALVMLTKGEPWMPAAS